MAVDYFLKVDGVDGESTVEGHVGELEVSAWSWGESNTTSAAHGGGAGAGRVSMQDFHVTLKSGRASPKLFLACASGRHIREAVLTARKAGERPQEFLTYRLTDVLVSSYQIAGDAPSQDRPGDEIALAFGRIELEYRPQAADGTLEQAVRFGFDLKQNRAV
jgi:type VI secretion system secreted protein Hcp